MVDKFLIFFCGPTYYSTGDEKAFFDWLQSIPCVGTVGGRGRELHIELKAAPDDHELRELLALLFRYRINMRPLAALKTSGNAAWFSENKDAYWYAGVFGDNCGRSV